MDNVYAKLGYDAFLNRGPGSIDSSVRGITEVKSKFRSAVDFDSETEKISLGQSKSLVISDGKTNRILIGFQKNGFSL